MKKITIEIETENAAFQEDGNGGHSEAARVLRNLARDIETNNRSRSFSLRDGLQVDLQARPCRSC